MIPFPNFFSQERSTVNQPPRQQLRQLITLGILLPISATALLSAFQYFFQGGTLPIASSEAQANPTPIEKDTGGDILENRLMSRPKLDPAPLPQETWNCEVVVVGGSLGGVAAASQAMQSGATTCVIELSPWLGGDISSQGVSAIDESRTMIREQNFAPSWKNLKQLIKEQLVELPAWTNVDSPRTVRDLNSCWVGELCFLPKVGAQVAEQLLATAAAAAPDSRWRTQTAFKGAEFDPTGKEITAIYAVQRLPKDPNYLPLGRLSQELFSWYAWSADATFDKVPIRLQAPPGKRMLVIDATDMGEVVGWAGIPYRLGSEAQSTTSEFYASERDNPDCTQAFTYPFTLAIKDDAGKSMADLNRVETLLPEKQHTWEFNLQGFPMFKGGSFFHYRRLVSTTMNEPHSGYPSWGDITMVNWNQGNDWIWMNPPLILNEKKIAESGQHQNWMGGVSLQALRHAEDHALLFAKWLIETQATPELPLALLSGADSPMATVSGLSMMPYIREGRRILGRSAYGQTEFMLREPDLRKDMRGERDLTPTAVGVTHYRVDLHGCRYRDWSHSWEASSAPLENEAIIKPTVIPIEALIPQGVDNLLIGGKGIAATHIVNAATRIHYGEWVIGSAAGATAGWLTTQTDRTLIPADIVPKQRMQELQDHMKEQGLRVEW